MDNRPIGVFDSGLGGLTAVSRLTEVLPNEDIVYFGDTGRVPYGGRSHDTIEKYAKQDVSLLLKYDVKAVLAACGTVSTVALDDIAPLYPLPIFGVVHPAAKAAAERSKSGRIGLIGTEASVRSGTYERAVRKYAPFADVIGRACPLFVPLVENGRIKRGDVVIEQVAREYLLPLKDAGIDTLILGCTHYPLLEDIISDILPGVSLISPGAEAAAALAVELESRSLLSGSTEKGSSKYLVSDSPDNFSRLASLFLRRSVSENVTQVDIDLL